MHVCGCVEKDDPFAAGEGFCLAGERVNISDGEFCGRGTFELNRELMRIERMTRRDEVHVIAQYRAGIDRESRTLGICGEARGDGFNLRHRELHGGALESSLGSKSLSVVMRPMRDGTGFGGFGRSPDAKEFPRTDERRPRPAGIIREPKAVGAEDDVIGDHGLFGFVSRDAE